MTDKVPMLGEGPDSDYVITRFDYYPYNGDASGHSGSLLWKVTDGNNHETTFEYKPSGMKSKVTYPLNGFSSTMTWTYDENHNMIARQSPSGYVQTLAYDSRNRKKSMRWSNEIDWSDFDYDAAGRLSWATNPYSIVHREYDPAGRMNLDRQTMPSVTPTPMPGITIPSVVSRQRHGEQLIFDIPLPLQGDPGIESRAGGDENRYQIVATFADHVDVDGVKLISGTGTILDYSSAITTDGGTEITIQLGEVSDAQKLTILLINVQDGDESADIEIPMHVLVGNVTGSGTVGENDSSELDSHNGEAVTIDNFRCDVNADGVIDVSDAKLVAGNAGDSLTPPTPAMAGEVSCDYDNDGRVTHLWVPNTGYDYTQTYDGQGRLKQIYKTSNSSDYFQCAYDQASNLLSRFNNMNQTVVEYFPDRLNRITDAVLRPSPSPAPSPRNWLVHETYRYDQVNRLIAITRTGESVSDQFGYYLDGELKWAQYGSTAPVPTATPYATPPTASAVRKVEYNLDKAGNRTGMAGVTADGTPFNYEPNALNEYTTAQSGSVWNGANHEITSYQGVNYTYLNDTRLAQATKAATESPAYVYQLGYDALGRCVKRVTNGVATYYIYDGERPIVEFDANGSIAATNVYGRGIDEVIARDNNGAAQYPMQDHEGSVVVVTGGNGAILEWYRYDAFGAPAIYDASNHQRSVTAINNRFLFTGREYVPQFGFYEYRARAYHPVLGRFMSEDPIGFDAGDYNLFRYVGNDPLDHTDPMGLWYPVYVQPPLPKPSPQQQPPVQMNGTIGPRTYGGWKNDYTNTFRPDSNNRLLPNAQAVSRDGSMAESERAVVSGVPLVYRITGPLQAATDMNIVRQLNYRARMASTVRFAEGISKLAGWYAVAGVGGIAGVEMAGTGASAAEVASQAHNTAARKVAIEIIKTAFRWGAKEEGPPPTQRLPAPSRPGIEQTISRQAPRSVIGPADAPDD